MKHLITFIWILLFAGLVAANIGNANPKTIGGISIEEYSYEVQWALYDFYHGFEELRQIFIEAQKELKGLMRGQGAKDNLGNLLEKLLTGRSREITLRSALGIENYKRKYIEKFNRWYSNQRSKYYQIRNLISKRSLLQYFDRKYNESNRDIVNWKGKIAEIGK
jgi:hypothetical protein